MKEVTAFSNAKEDFFRALDDSKTFRQFVFKNASSPKGVSGWLSGTFQYVSCLVFNVAHETAPNLYDVNKAILNINLQN